MTATLTESGGSGESVSPFWGWRGNRRPEPKFGQVFAGLGGFLVGFAVVIYAGEQFGKDRKLLGALMCAAAVVAAVFGAAFKKDPFRAACAGIIIPTVYGAWGMLIFSQDNTDVDDMKIVFLMASLTYLGLYLAPSLRGRAVFLVFALIGTWMLGVIQVGDNAFSGASGRSSRSAQHALSATPGPAGQSARMAKITGSSSSVPDYCTDSSYAEMYPEECDPTYTDSTSDSSYVDDSGDPTYSDGSDDSSGVDSSDDSYDYSDPSDSSNDVYDYSDDSNSGSGSNDVFSNVTPSDPFSAFGSAASRFGNDVSWLTLLFGLAYLGAGFGLDRKRRTGFATPFIGTALFLVPLGAVLTSYDFSSLNDVSTARIGIQTLIAGSLLALVGASSVVTRRATTWLGAWVATGGLTTWIMDAIRPETANGNATTILIIGAIMIGAGFAGSILLKEGPEEPSKDGPDLQPALVDAPEPAAASTDDAGEVSAGEAAVASTDAVEASAPEPEPPASTEES